VKYCMLSKDEVYAESSKERFCDLKVLRDPKVLVRNEPCLSQILSLLPA